MKIPLFHELEKAQNILIAGAGGGFDVFCGLPLYFWLKNAGRTVHLANLSSGALGLLIPQKGQRDRRSHQSFDGFVLELSP